MATVTEIQQSNKDAADQYALEAERVAADLEAQADAIRNEFINFDTSRFSVNAVNDIPAPGEIDGIAELQALVLNLNPDDLLNDNFKKHVYESVFFDFLEPKLIEFITEESTGIAQDIQDALFDNMYERDLQTLNDAVEQMERLHGGRGFPIPTSMLVAGRNELISKYQEQRDNRNREVTALIAERAQQNVHHSIDAGIKMEDIQSRFTLSFAQNWFRTGDLIIAQYRAQVDAAIARINASVQEQELIVRTNIANGNIDEGDRQRYIQQWQIRIQAEIQETAAEIDQALSRADKQLAATRSVMEYYKDYVTAAVNATNGLAILQE